MVKWPLNLSVWRRPTARPKAQVEVSPGGSEIHRHGGPEELHSIDRETSHLYDILDHLKSVLGELASVWQDTSTDQLHIDVLVFAPKKDRPFWTLVTSGMSDRAMNAPPELTAYGDFRRAELVMSLPIDWPEMEYTGPKAGGFLPPETGWPISLLRYLARLPFAHQTWLWQTHTVDNGTPPAPLASNTGLVGSYLEFPATWPKNTAAMLTSTGTLITFIAVIPLYREEMQLKLERGHEELMNRFEAAGITEILDIRRPNVALYHS